MYKRVSKITLKYFITLFSIKTLLFLTVFSFPTHFFWVWRPEWSYWNGIFIDYWAPKVWFSTLMVLFLWLCSLWEADTTRGKTHQTLKKRWQTLWRAHRFLFLGFAGWLLITLLQIWTAAEPLRSVNWMINTLLGPVAFGFWLLLHKEHLSSFWKAVFLTAFFQASVGFYQLIFQSELAGYWLLGEPAFHQYAGLATSEFTYAWRYLPYGTTAHPNLLAGWLLAGLMGCYYLWKHTWHRVPLLIMSLFLGVCLLATESFSALFTLIVLGIVLLFRRVRPSSSFLLLGFMIIQFLFFTLFPLVSHTTIPSLYRRQLLLASTPTLISSHPWGMGPLQHLTNYKPETQKSLQAFSTQPIHHFWVIFAIESGWWIIFVFLIIVYKEQNNYPLFLALLLPIFSLDHYTYTLNSGLFLIAFYALFFSFLTDN